MHDNVQTEHEEAFMQQFVVRNRRERWRGKLRLKDHDRRREFLHEELARHDFWNPRFEAKRLDRYDKDLVLRTLRSRGAPDGCNVMAWDFELDGRRIPLDKAIARDEHTDRYIVSCIPGRLAWVVPDDDWEHLGIVLERHQ